MSKKITLVLSILIVFLIGAITGYFFDDNFSKDVSGYDIIYKTLPKLSTEEKMSIYTSKLKAETTPSELKYLLDEIAPTLNTDAQNDLLAQYLNHIQYYMSTYSDFVMIYQSIMRNSSATLNFEDASVSNQISDKLLKAMVDEIYKSDMKIVMPKGYSDDKPYILVDYDKIREQYGNIINQATADYIKFKEVAQNGELSDETGQYNFDRLGDYIIDANNFIDKYPNYPLVSDVIYSYTLASKMYLGIYNVSEPFMADDITIDKYKKFLDENPNTPIANAIKEIIELYNKGEMISMELINEWVTQIDGLLPQ